MLPYILPLIDDIKHTVYVEPFAGGGTVLFNKPVTFSRASGHYREVLNDTSDLLINFYRVAQKYPDELLAEINATLYSESDYNRAKVICKNPDGHDSLTLAWAFYVNSCQSFSKILHGGWGRSVSSQNFATTWDNQKKQLWRHLDRLSKVHVSNQDALTCIRQWDSPQSLFYIDPPYPNTDQGHYSGYSLEDWSNLCSLLDNIDGSYILSCYPQEIAPKSVQRKLEIASYCSTAGAGKTAKNQDKTKTVKLEGRERVEILWLCDRSAKMRDELQSITKHKQLQLFGL